VIKQIEYSNKKMKFEVEMYYLAVVEAYEYQKAYYIDIFIILTVLIGNMFSDFDLVLSDGFNSHTTG